MQQDNFKTQNQKLTKIYLVFSIIFLILLSAALIFLIYQQKILKDQISHLKKDKQETETQIENIEKEKKLIEDQLKQVKKEKEELEKKMCQGVWKDGSCFKRTCVDSDVNEKPYDIYIQGKVTYLDEDGLEKVAFDECTDSKKQVKEWWCYEYPPGSGNYVPGVTVFNCKKGCFNGACLK